LTTCRDVTGRWQRLHSSFKRLIHDLI